MARHGYVRRVLIIVAVLFPVAMLLGLLLMDRIEQPLRVDEIGLQLERFFDNARPDEVELFVTNGYAPALERYWRRTGRGGPVG